MNQHELFQTGLTSSIVILFVYVKIVWAQYNEKALTAECTQMTTEGLSAAKCATDYFSGIKQDFYKLPTTLPASLQIIDCKPKDDNAYSGIVIEANTFKPFPQLKRIVMKKNIQILHAATSSSLIRKEQLQDVFKYALVGLNSLEYLEMNECYLGDWVPVHLPKQVKSINFDRNRYRKLDVHWASDLEELSAKENYLENIPKLSVPKPPLKILRLNENPLKEMTITDIAQLCEITVLELHFSDKDFYASEAGYCQCSLLKKWANETELKGVQDVKCFNVANKSGCSENLLEEARHIRKKCPLLKTGVTSTSIQKGLKYTFMLIMLALLAASFILYIIRHFHLREYWAAHHLRMAQDLSLGMDEEEEEPFQSPGEQSIGEQESASFSIEE